MSTPPTQEIRLSEREFQMLKRYADLHGMTLEQASDVIANESVRDKFQVAPRLPGRVVSFPLRGRIK